MSHFKGHGLLHIVDLMSKCHIAGWPIGEGATPVLRAIRSGRLHWATLMQTFVVDPVKGIAGEEVTKKLEATGMVIDPRPPEGS